MEHDIAPVTQLQAESLVNQFGCAACLPRAGEIAAYMVVHRECVAHAAYIVMGWPVCTCSPCRRKNRLA